MGGQFKRYLVFYGECGGWDDYFGEFDTLNEAIVAGKDGVGHSDYQIVDTHTKQHVPPEDYAIQGCRDIVYEPSYKPLLFNLFTDPRQKRDVITFLGPSSKIVLTNLQVPGD